MDQRVRHPSLAQLRAALLALLPPDARRHPDAAVLRDPVAHAGRADEVTEAAEAAEAAEADTDANTDANIDANADVSHAAAEADDDVDGATPAVGGPGTARAACVAAAPHAIEAAAAAPEERALQALADHLGLSTLERAAALLALWVEVDPRASAAVALLQGGAGRPALPRPTLGLLAALAGPLAPLEGTLPSAAGVIGHLLRGVACSCGLLRPGEPGAPAHARTLALAPPLLAALADPASTAPLTLDALQIAPLPAPAWPLPPAWRDGLARLAAQARASDGPCVLVLRGGDGQELAALAAALGRQLGRRALALRASEDAPGLAAAVLAAQAGPAGLVPALGLAGALPVWAPEAAPGQVTRVPALPHWSAPLLLLAGVDGVFESELPLHEFEAPRPTIADRATLWRALRPAAPPAEAELAGRTRCGLSVLARAAAVDAPAAAAIEQAVHASARGLAAWAQVSAGGPALAAWVGPPTLQRALALLHTRCEVRDDAAAALGPLLRGRLGAGVKALFIGASGTGKTLAAQWLADRLARPLVRVDLAAVVSKYIGETEKNLAQLLARAEHLDAVLLFDEADSLFGARTDVKQANDRYANMQTNYLLQRLETFHGVALLTSNSKARFDDAFLRRLDTVIDFPLPDVAERRALWALHLGAQPGLDAAFVNAVAATADLAGGHIRNAALTAALLARRRGDGASIAPDDLRLALAQEYHKLGQRGPAELGLGGG